MIAFSAILGYMLGAMYVQVFTNHSTFKERVVVGLISAVATTLLTIYLT